MSNIITYKKKIFNPAEATPEDILIEDIAHALSLLCRANGHFPHFFSVAQHCINCATEAKVRGYSDRIQFGCLLHDASEAYLSDITRPVKPLISGYLDIEKRLQNIIFEKWISPSITDEERTLIFAVDDAMLYHEFLSIAGERLSPNEPVITSSPIFSPLPFEEIEKTFLDQFDRLRETN